eukprot:CAMPEP_0174232740 /NCGR_PEP_ID=MMETSP0417-20130205/2950_1 /TAXON_ID=242541 /ORGANISM="Mayorella sp, Strain BSH-02190019" /LENGTH=1256 /DNA_ID=CAMNT_0015310841 /DNA_START=98 /DNA_END=3865 /DNA_ORIENTATION=-
MSSLATVGARVSVKGKPGAVGIVRFVGPIKQAKGTWVGVELDRPEGRNDGSIKGDRYFQCEPKYGCFVKEGSLLDPPPLTSSPSSPSSSTDTAKIVPAEAATASPTAPAASHRRTSSDSKPSTSSAEHRRTPSSSSSGNVSHRRTPSSSSGSSSSSSGNVSHRRAPSSNTTAASQPAQDAPPPTTVSTPDSSAPTATSSSASNDALEAAAAKQKLEVMRRTFAQLEEDLTTLQRWKKEAEERLKQANVQLSSESEKSAVLLKQVEEAQAQAKRAVRETEERLGRECAEAKAELVRVRDQLEETESRIEAVTLDQELAEGQCEDLQEELEEVRAQLEETQAMLKAAQESVQQARSGEGAAASAGDEDAGTLRAQRDHLREALVKLRDLSLAERRELQQSLRGLQKELTEAGKLQEQLDESEAHSLDLQEEIASLKEQLDLSAEAEELLSEAQEQNLTLQERVEELQRAVDDLEALRELSTELEAEAQDTERDLRAEIYQRDVRLLSRQHELEAAQRDIKQQQQRLEASTRRTVALQQQLREHEMRAMRQAQEHAGQGEGLQCLVDEAVRLRRLCAELPSLRQRSLLAEGTLQLVEHRARFLLGFIPSPVLAEHRRAADRRLRIALAVLRASVLYRLLDAAWSPVGQDGLAAQASLATADGDRVFAWQLRALVADAAQHLAAVLTQVDQLSESAEHAEVYVRLANAQWLPSQEGIDPLLSLDAALHQLLRAQASDELNDTRADLHRALETAVQQFTEASSAVLDGEHVAGWACVRQIEVWHAQVQRAQLYAQRLWSGLASAEQPQLLPLAHFRSIREKVSNSFPAISDLAERKSTAPAPSAPSPILLEQLECICAATARAADRLESAAVQLARWRSDSTEDQFTPSEEQLEQLLGSLRGPEVSEEALHHHSDEMPAASARAEDATAADSSSSVSALARNLLESGVRAIDEQLAEPLLALLRYCEEHVASTQQEATTTTTTTTTTNITTVWIRRATSMRERLEESVTLRERVAEMSTQLQSESERRERADLELAESRELVSLLRERTTQLQERADQAQRQLAEAEAATSQQRTSYETTLERLQTQLDATRQQRQQLTQQLAAVSSAASPAAAGAPSTALDSSMVSSPSAGAVDAGGVAVAVSASVASSTPQPFSGSGSSAAAIYSSQARLRAAIRSLCESNRRLRADHLHSALSPTSLRPLPTFGSATTAPSAPSAPALANTARVPLGRLQATNLEVAALLPRARAARCTPLVIRLQAH